MSDLPVIDLEKFIDFVGDKDEIQPMATLFIEQAAAYLLELTGVREDGTNEEWHAITHKFKGMSAFAGAERLCLACKTAQTEWQADPARKQELFTMIQTETDKAIKEFERIKDYI